MVQTRGLISTSTNKGVDFNFDQCASMIHNVLLYATDGIDDSRTTGTWLPTVSIENRSKF